MPSTELSSINLQIELTPNQSIYKWAKERPNAIALVSGSLELSYIQLANGIAKFVKVFEALGIQTGMIVGLNIKDSSYHRVSELMMILSLEIIGAIRLSIPSDDDVSEYCQFIFTDSPFKLSSEGPSVFSITKEWINSSLNTAISNSDLERLNNVLLPNDPLFIGSTSGTTGKKKYFIEQMHKIVDMRALISAAYFSNAIKNYLTIYPVRLRASYIGASIAFIKGGTIFFVDLENFFQNIANHPNSYSAMIIKDINYLHKHFPEGRDSHKLSTFRVLGSHLPANIRTWVETYLAEEVVNSYSSNESDQIAEALPNGQCRMYPDVKVRIVDEYWQDLESGDLGYVSIQSPMQISGYLWNPELNALHFKDGWFRSNDIGYLTPEGNLVLVDRADNMLNLAGIKVAPAPIEAEIKLLSGVKDCVLLEEDTLSELQTIAICLEVSSKDLDRVLLEKTITTFVAKYFKSYRFYYFSSFPSTESGKVKRKELQSGILKPIS